MAISRRRWGAHGSVPRDGARKHTLYFHHTVGRGGFRNAATERAELRDIDSLHRRTNGWDTIGYSYLLAPSGRLYVGRGFSGLPAAQEGSNTGSVACALLGNYEYQRPTKRQVARMVSLGLWCRARGVRRVGGHREAPGQSTACPGRHVMAVLSTVARRSRLRRV